MRHRIEKTYSVQKDAGDSSLSIGKQQLNSKLNIIKSHLLHSDKSAYFYKRKLDKLGGLSGFKRKEGFFNLKQLAMATSSNDSRVGTGRGSRHVHHKVARAISGKPAVGRMIPLALPVVSMLAFLLVLGYMINPVGVGDTDGAAYALENTSGVFGAEEIDRAEAIDLDAPVTSAVPPDDGVSLTIKDGQVPQNGVVEEQVSGGGAKYITVEFVVGAHNVDDYKIYVQASSTTLTGRNYDDTIWSVTSPTTAEDMSKAIKQWGYTVVEGSDADTGSMTFNSIQTGAITPAKTVTGDSGGKLTEHTQDYTLAFAANLDGATPDHYEANVVLSVAASAEDTVMTGTGFGAYVPGVGDVYIHTMQEMTTGVCHLVPTGTEGRLEDTRDHKVYWVSKLADGNCWMVQNLDLDLSDATLPLVPGSSDVLKSWTPVNKTITNSGLTGTWWDNGKAGTEPYSYDPGTWVYTKLQEKGNGESCGNVNGLTASTCASKGWEDVSSKQPSSDPNFYTGKKVVDGDTYDAHYLIGNYYSWPAATAGTGTAAINTNNANTTESICPAGWTLPEAGKDASSNIPTDQNKSFYNLLKAYGFPATGAVDSNKNFYFALDTSSKGYNMLQAPLYFLRGGVVNGSLLYDAGLRGHYWSSTASTSADLAYYLLFDNDDAYPSRFVSRFVGFSVRCVAR